MKCNKVVHCNTSKDDKPKHELIIGIQVDYDDMRFDFNVLWLLGFCTVVSLFLMTVALLLFDQQETNYFMFNNTGAKEFWLHYGVKSVFCTETFPYTPGMWPSFMRQVEHQYTVNMCYRAAVLIPMPFRIYIAFIMCTLLLKSKWNNVLLWKGYCLGNNIINFIAVVEILSQAIFSVNSLRFDNPTLYQYGFTIFVISSTIYMWMRTVLNLQVLKDKRTNIDTLSFLIKTISAAIYTSNISEFYHYHLKFILEPSCHPYINKEQALPEYLVILSYLFFHLTILIDVRNVRLVCYPTSSSEKREVILSKSIIPDQNISVKDKPFTDKEKAEEKRHQA
uniref:Uncharacterized protein n=1 Tax=Panagrolaimus sp. PS1159 TaxID=55785 RepID=A0AC35FU08_9BILA